jgi:cell wall-associated NlpC family hydrolase
VAIYNGNGQMIQAPNSGAYVELAPMRWSGFIGATRPGT